MNPLVFILLGLSFFMNRPQIDASRPIASFGNRPSVLIDGNRPQIDASRPIASFGNRPSVLINGNRPQIDASRPIAFRNRPSVLIDGHVNEESPFYPVAASVSHGCNPPSKLIKNIGCVQAVTVLKTWFQARANCDSMQATLLSIFPAGSLQELGEAFNSAFSPATSVWTGPKADQCPYINMNPHPPVVSSSNCSELYVSLCLLNSGVVNYMHPLPLEQWRSNLPPPASTFEKIRKS